VAGADVADFGEDAVRHVGRAHAGDDAVGLDAVDGELLDDRLELGGRAHDAHAVDGAAPGVGGIVEHRDDLVGAGGDGVEEWRRDVNIRVTRDLAQEPPRGLTIREVLQTRS
jgi:hypothetical protein